LFIVFQREDHIAKMEAVSRHAHEREREDQGEQFDLERMVHAM